MFFIFILFYFYVFEERKTNVDSVQSPDFNQEWEVLTEEEKPPDETRWDGC